VVGRKQLIDENSIEHVPPEGRGEAPRLCGWSFGKNMTASHKFIEIGTIIALAALCALSDYLLKRASALPHPFTSIFFYSGMIGYALSAFGWVYVLRWFKLSTIGAIYSIVLIGMLAIIGVTAFSEKITTTEIIGLILACVSIIILTRFS